MFVLNFNKPYEKQDTKSKKKICKHDFYEIKSLLIFKEKLKKAKTEGG